VKTLTRKQIESRKEKAVRFVRDVLGDPDRADEIDQESLNDYASRRKIQLLNPVKGKTMAKIRLFNPRAATRTNRIPGTALQNAGATATQEESPSVAALRQQNQELQSQNDDLQDQLDRIADLAGCDDPNCPEEENALVDKLNDILDIAAAGDVDEGDEDNEGE
jgi:hypothetical protein